MPRPGYDNIVLVTGLPAIYPRRMLEHILTAEPRALVYAPVPAPYHQRVQNDLEPLPPDHKKRIILMEGDPAAMDLGLSGAEFRQLTREIDRIHHVAHINHSAARREVAHRCNVVSAAEILEVARAASSLQCVVFHSTAHVSGDRTGVVYEDELEAGQSFRSAAEETRMSAEVLIHRAMRELPIAVVRPTTLVGDVGSSETDRLDGIYLLALFVLATPADIAIPFPGRGETPVNIVPVDYVVRAAHTIGRHRSAPGRTFHLADPYPLSARSIFELVARAGGRRPGSRGNIPSNLAKALLRTPGIDRFVKSPRAFVEQLTTQVRYDTKNTDQILRGTGITCPPFESYVVDLVNIVQEHINARQKRREIIADTELDVEDPLLSS